VPLLILLLLCSCQLLRELGESTGTPADHLGTLGAAKAQKVAALSAPLGTPIGRLALEEYPDQALAREELAAVDLAAARVDMSELLPRNAFDPSYATATAAHAQRSAASMGSFLSVRPTGQDAGGDYSYSYYSYDDDGPEGYSGEYGGAEDQYYGSYQYYAPAAADGEKAADEAGSNYSCARAAASQMAIQLPQRTSRWLVGA
jgi:hypothetical protein